VIVSDVVVLNNPQILPQRMDLGLTQDKRLFMLPPVAHRAGPPPSAEYTTATNAFEISRCARPDL